MTQLDWYIDESRNLMQDLAQPYMAGLQAAVEAAPFEWWDLNLGQMAQAVAPSALTRDTVLARIPYNSPDSIDALLGKAAERGMLEPAAGQAGFQLTQEGGAFIDQVVSTVREGLAEVSGQIPQAERLVELLGRQVEGCCRNPGIDMPSLAGSRTFDPGADAAQADKLRRYLQDLNAWRDDVHVAAWRQEGAPAHEWEVFSHVWGHKVWGDPVRTPAEAVEKMGFRGYDEAAYAEALDNLAGRGWLAKAEDGSFAMTDAGKQVRERCEVETDRLFFAPWSISEAEAAELKGLVAEARKALQAE